ncbi:MAG TPA: hypothetical protein VGM03_16095 [Phycisphaerae bacterium]
MRVIFRITFVLVAGALCLGFQADQRDDHQTPLDIKLPKPAFKGTPKHVPPGTNLEAPRQGPRPPFKAAPGAKNLAAGKPVSSSDKDPIVGKLSFVTDGDKEANEGSYVELGPRLQWVQIDLDQPCTIYAVVVWHYHANARVYHDVIVQVSDDKDFLKDVKTLFNNEHDNSSGLGIGQDKEYWETYEGKLIDAKGVTARYVRLYSQGSTADDQNHYTEVEVYGLPAK